MNDDLVLMEDGEVHTQHEPSTNLIFPSRRPECHSFGVSPNPMNIGVSCMLIAGWHHFVTDIHQTPLNSMHMYDADDSLSDALRSNLTRLIAYAKSADPDLQRQVAEKLANEAVKRKHVPRSTRGGLQKIQTWEDSNSFMIATNIITA